MDAERRYVAYLTLYHTQLRNVGLFTSVSIALLAANRLTEKGASKKEKVGMDATLLATAGSCLAIALVISALAFGNIPEDLKARFSPLCMLLRVVMVADATLLIIAVGALRDVAKAVNWRPRR